MESSCDISTCGWLTFQVLCPSSSQIPSLQERAAPFRRVLCARSTINNTPQGLWLKCFHKFLAEPCLLLTSNLPFPIFVMNQVSTLRNTQSQMLQEDPGNILLLNLHADWSKCPGHSHSDSAIRGGQVKRSNLSLLHGNLSSHPDSLAPRTSADEKG